MGKDARWVHTARLLVIDDQAEFRDYLCKVLRKGGWSRIDSAADGRQGLELLARHAYDLCLLDLAMPRLDGLGLLRTIQDHPIAADFLVLTSSQEPEQAVVALQLGARDYLTKPFDPERLFAAIEHILFQRRPPSDILAERLTTYTTSHIPRRAVIRPINILIVEDHDGLHKAYARLLLAAGYQVASATTLKEAYQRIGDRHIDLILLDLGLPDGDGLTLLRQLHAQSHSASVIVISGREDMGAAMQAGRLGAHTFLTKPFSVEELLGEINNALIVEESAVVSYIKAHCRRIQGRQQVAAHFRMHEKTVSRHVKDQTGFSFLDFLHQCKIAEAKRLLAETAHAIKDIAAQTGFTSPQHFARVFREHTGANPSTYRRKNKA